MGRQGAFLTYGRKTHELRAIEELRAVGPAVGQ